MPNNRSCDLVIGGQTTPYDSLQDATDAFTRFARRRPGATATILVGDEPTYNLSLGPRGAAQRQKVSTMKTTYPAGTVIYSVSGKFTGKLTGAARRCRLEGCTGLAYTVKWDDGQISYPCTKSMTQRADGSLSLGTVKVSA